MNLSFLACSDSDWKPHFINPRTIDGQKVLSLLREDPSILVHAQIESQLGEMLKARYPRNKYKGKILGDAINNFFLENDKKLFGEWVYYPWSRRLIHILSKEDFIATRISPNNPKITKAEQAMLADKKVGIVGLSVGQSISIVLAMERICGEIRIADFDILELANLNRIRSGLHNMGINKSVMVAREIMEFDPYFEIRCFTDRITRENMDSFFHDGGNLDLIVDECDSIDIKILLREKSRKIGIPVVMDMSDRGTIDIERFDLEPERPLLHGWIDHLDYSNLGNLTNEEKVPFMLPIFGMNTISKRLKASMIEIGETIHTWPQLATSVAMGGALAADTVRRIFLDQFHDSGRYFIDLDILIGDKKKESFSFTPQKYEFPALEEKVMISQGKEALKKLNWAQGALQPEDLEALISLSAMAPSAGNNQPWKWLYLEGTLFLFHEKSRSYSWTDYDDSLAYLALGACTENLHLGAARLGYRIEQELINEDQLIAAFRFYPEKTQQPDLARGIELRCTNRKKAAYIPVPDEVSLSIQNAVSVIPGMQAELITDRDALEGWTKICGKAEKLRLLDPQGHYEFFTHEMRWDEEDVMRTRDGLDIETLELTPEQIAGMEVSSDPEVIDIIRKWKVGQGLEKVGSDTILASSALCLITCDKNLSDYSLLLGSALQRAWIAANLAGWAVHPVSAPLFFTNRQEKPDNLMNKKLVEEILIIKKDMNKITSILQDRRGVFLFRLSFADEPSKRAIRLLNKEILIKN